MKRPPVSIRYYPHYSYANPVRANEMQTVLQQEELDFNFTDQTTTEIYNRTPAMLFSLEGNALLSAVSDYWLLATGYERQDIVGRPFADRVAEADRALYAGRKARGRPGPQAVEVTVGFIRWDGGVMDVLIAERELGAAGDATGSLNVMTDVTDPQQSAQNRKSAVKGKRGEK